MLLIEGENVGADIALPTSAEPLAITRDQFDEFVARHRRYLDGTNVVLVPESNAAMRNSYLILDERMRFLDNRHGQKRPGVSILESSVAEALQSAGFDEKEYTGRDGAYWKTMAAYPGQQQQRQGCGGTDNLKDIEDL